MAGLGTVSGCLVLFVSVLAVRHTSAQECGKVQVLKQGLIFGGTASMPGMWPWHVAVFHRESPRRTSYKCGGTIINRDTILTAYHCVVENHRPIAAGRLITRAGLFDLDVGGRTVQENRVFDVISPPGASARTFNDDIAILKMQTQFIYDDYVQPVCIRSVPQDIGQLVNTFGTVVGWGWTEENTTSAELRQANVPVVSAEDCLASDRNLFSQVLTTKVYCAGSRNGTSSCNGDSGGGMFFRMAGYWFLRGLTSFSSVDENQSGLCNSHGYVGYTDVSKYLDWVRDQGVRFEDPLRRASPSPSGKPIPSDGSTALLRLTVDPKTKRFLQQHKGNVLLRVQLNGCLQYDNVPGYNETLEYFATDNFRHVGHTHNSKYIRVGMVGPTDGIIRFGKSRFPYGESVSEICLSGWTNQNSEVNRHTRSSNSEYVNTPLKIQLTPDVLSRTRPMMFRLEVFDNGNVLLTKDGEKRPFLEFNDNHSRLDLDYIAFTKWNHDLFYYYDCPLHTDSSGVDDTVLLRCNLA
uniref:Peptidase S1 domain-containing protein n=1 Tax=Anopheles epiroticus TaxID=199890 RepID=A0A182PAZ8_9DIPT